MTTIATDGRVMAGDTQMTACDEVVGFTQKVHRTVDGRLLGSSGASADCALFAKWMHGEIERPELADEFAALVLTPEGKVFYVCRKLEPIEFIAPQAIGSGGAYAIGAMLAGATPVQAVAVAASRDVKTGGQISHLEINQ